MSDVREKFEKAFRKPKGVSFSETVNDYLPESDHQRGESVAYSYMFRGYQQGVKDMQAENERLVAWLKRIQKSAGGREDDINDMDSKLCDIWLAADEALALEPYKD